jgi:structural maintenance of chromosome 3 (chondroitin sulfate proteoglycan 6)
MKYEPMYEKAVQQVFGKAIIAQNLSVAAQYARTHGLTAVTPEGDRSDKKGALTGGYHDTRNSRLKATKIVVEARRHFDTIKSEGSKTKREIELMDQKITGVVGEMQNIDQRRNRSQGNQRILRQNLRNKIDLLEKKRNDLEAKEKQSKAIDSNVMLLSTQQTTYQDERHSEFKKALTSAEEEQLENVTKSIQQLRKDFSKLAESRAETEAKKADLEVKLNSNLKPQLAALEGDELDSESNSATSLQSRRRELDRLNKDHETVQRQLDEVEALLESKSSAVISLEAQEAEAKRAQEELNKVIERHQRRLEKSIQKKAALVASKQDLVESIRELGAVPDDLKNKFRKVGSDQIVKRLQKVKESLKKYTSVNKHAFEHYRKSMKQREELDTRREELQKAKDSIQELLEVLDQRKDEAIERTFKQVSKAFAEVFQKLVPLGRGRLIIQRKTDLTQADDDSDDEPASNKKGVENYTGVGISVSFNSKHDDQQKIQQLSGGQKSKCQNGY